MAEIKIEKKTTIWPWALLGLIILALAAYFLFFKDKKSDVVALNNGSENTATQNGPKSAVDVYVMYIEQDTANMSLDHEYSHDALVKLANATEETAGKNDVDITENLNKVKALAEKITQNEESTTHADDVKASAKILSSAIASIQQNKFPDLKSDVDDLMSDAQAIDGTDLTLDQKGTVKSFFRSAADVLKSMNNY